jgi:Leucine-rich repeat (LRR) protein
LEVLVKKNLFFVLCFLLFLGGIKAQNSNELSAVLSEALKQKNKIKILDLSSFGIEELPNEILSLKKLEHLDLSFNQLKKYPQDLFKLKSLRELNLKGNQIKELNSEQLNKKLVFLNLSGNPIDTLSLQASTQVHKSLNFQDILLNEVCIVKTSLKALFSRLPINSAKVNVYSDNVYFRTFEYDETLFKYEIVLPLGKSYLLDYTANGFYLKRIEIDLRNISDAHSNGYFSLEISLELIEEQSNFEGEAPKLPIGKAAFNHEKGSIEWDIPYLAKQSKINEEFIEIIKNLREESE